MADKSSIRRWRKTIKKVGGRDDFQPATSKFNPEIVFFTFLYPAYML